MYHPVVDQIKDLLEECGVPFALFEHEAVRTSEEAAALRPNYTLAQGAKALIVRAKLSGAKQFAMVVVPGDKKFDAKKVRAALGASDIRFATAEEVSEMTGGVEPGGVPPFGNLFGLTVLADGGVFENDEIIFNAGDRRVSIAIETDAYRSIVQPKVAEITT